MKIFKSTLLVLATLLAFSSCQKELEFDNNGVSIGTLKKDASGDCLPVTVNGVFKVDSVLTNALFVDVQVNVTNPGTFDIRTDTVNGFSFARQGSVVFGTNTIRLYPSGKPLAAGTNTFTVKYGTSTCTFDITVVGSGTGTAVFSLGGSPGGCTGASVGGSYTVGVPLTPANTLTIQVDVTTLGTYSIAAASTAGFLFTGTGTFTTLGLQNVTLNGSGTPLSAGNTAVTVTNIASTCTFNVTVIGASPAVFTLDGAPNGCNSYIVAGNYTVGSTASASNTVKLNVTVTTPGAYVITTNTVNGISFSGAGTLAAGAQVITLTASGTPLAAGTFNTFAPNITNSCSFAITFVAAPPPPVGDYFPLTANSWWSYDVAGSTDTLYDVLIGAKSYNSNTYSEMRQDVASVPQDTLHYRKSGNDYFQWAPSDYYSAYFAFDNTVYADLNFLKENAATGTTWSSPVYSGTVNALAANLQYDYKIVSANTSLTINSVNYTNVIFVNVAVKVSLLGGPYTTIENNEFYYAKGIGLIKLTYKDASTGTVNGEGTIRNYKVF